MRPNVMRQLRIEEVLGRRRKFENSGHFASGVTGPAPRHQTKVAPNLAKFPNWIIPRRFWLMCKFWLLVPVDLGRLKSFGNLLRGSKRLNDSKRLSRMYTIYNSVRGLLICHPRRICNLYSAITCISFKTIYKIMSCFFTTPWPLAKGW